MFNWFGNILMIASLLSMIAVVVSESQESSDEGFCTVDDKSDNCIKTNYHINNRDKFIFYDVNPPEGFNLRRDVYMRMAVFIHNLKKIEKYKNVRLVLPPWNYLYHWKSRDVGSQNRIPWSLFFNTESLNAFAPVIEFDELLSTRKSITFDRIYMLQHYADAFHGGHFREKWEILKDTHCEYSGGFWGYSNVMTKHLECVAFQGSASKLKELVDLHPSDEMILFTNAEIALHDEYGTSKFWDVRKSMTFNKELLQIANDFIKEEFHCSTDLCDNYISVHWRRGDFARGRPKEVPSIEGTVNQLLKIINNQYESITSIFIATDADESEAQKLTELLQSKNFVVKRFIPSYEVRVKFKDGGVAIIDQIICSRAAYFVGTHESTFTFRIQEEREILGFDSLTTFNRLCPDSGNCERPSRWKIVHS